MKKFLSELWHRLKSKTPPFFKKVQAAGGVITTTGIGMITGGNLRSGAIVAGAGMVVGFIASLACTDHSEDVSKQVTNKN